jgi:N-acetyl-anhydromuramyl-L-alanine amidase AmpD
MGINEVKERATFKASPNVGGALVNPKLIVIHWIVGTYESAVSWFSSSKSQVSAHYVVDKQGQRITQMVQLNRQAWHAGPSYHPLCGDNINKFSIGIELEGPPSSIGEHGWDSKLYIELGFLCQYIVSLCPTIVGIVDHSTISPHLKQDVKRGTGIDLIDWDAIVRSSGLPDLTVDNAALIRKRFNLT